MSRLHGYLPWIIVATTVTIAAAVRLSGSGGTARKSPLGPSRIDAGQAGAASHYVAPWQLVESNGMVNRVVDDLEALASDGRHMGWAQISAGQPVVLVFIKSGCPCSIEFEPYFHRVEQAYRGVVRFAGVIDGNLDSARRYASEQHVPYPVLADADRKIIRRFGAKNGCYVSVLTPNGVIDGFWPGSSAEALQELGRRIAKLAGTEERPLDVSGMPKALTTGCHFGI
jgi:peroxiredoxin